MFNRNPKIKAHKSTLRDIATQVDNLILTKNAKSQFEKHIDNVLREAEKYCKYINSEYEKARKKGAIYGKHTMAIARKVFKTPKDWPEHHPYYPAKHKEYFVLNRNIINVFRDFLIELLPPFLFPDLMFKKSRML